MYKICCCLWWIKSMGYVGDLELESNIGEGCNQRDNANKNSYNKDKDKEFINLDDFNCNITPTHSPINKFVTVIHPEHLSKNLKEMVENDAGDKIENIINSPNIKKTEPENKQETQIKQPISKVELVREPELKATKPYNEKIFARNDRSKSLELSDDNNEKIEIKMCEISDTSSISSDNSSPLADSTISRKNVTISPNYTYFDM